MNAVHPGMKVILFGATGMVGQGCLRECLLDADVESVLAIGRSPTGQRHAKLLRNSTLKTYKGFPHGMPTTEAETINADLLAFLKGAAKATA